jgi:ribosomal protein S18 acetylase RimI-like enzyme
MENLEIRRAGVGDFSAVLTLLLEAAHWLREKGMSLWDPETFHKNSLLPQVEDGDFWICILGGKVAGVLKFQMEDELYWPGFPKGEAVYVHKLTVSRRFAGQGLAGRMLDWAVMRGVELGRNYLRLDCEASRENLCRIYESFGFEREGEILLGERKMARFELKICR